MSGDARNPLLAASTALLCLLTLPGFIAPAASDSLAVEPPTVAGRFGHAMVWDARSDVAPECALGCAYLLGGGTAATAAIQRFSALHGDVTTVASLPLPVTYAAAAWSGERAYLFGGVGFSATDKIQVFDPATGTASVLPTTLPSRLQLAAAVWVDFPNAPCLTGCAYLFGGLVPPAVSGQGSYSDQILRFDPMTGLATVVATAPHVPGLVQGVSAGAAAVWAPAPGLTPGCPTGCVYLIGGTRSTIDGSDAIQRFDPVTNTLVDTLHRLPSGAFVSPAVWNDHDQVVHVFQRERYPAPARVLTYDPVAGSVTIGHGPAPPTDFYGAAAAWDPASGCALVTGGFSRRLGDPPTTPFDGVLSHRPSDATHDPGHACWPSDPRPGVTLTATGTAVDGRVRARSQPQGWQPRLLSGPSHGSLAWESGDAGAFRYTPEAGWTGADAFTFDLTDGTHATRAATHTVVVRDPPHLAAGAVRREADAPFPVSGHAMFWDGRATVDPACILGCAYLVGKENFGGDRSDRIHRFSAATGAYTELPVRMPAEAGFASSVWTGTKMYAFGGSVYSDRIVSFDPASLEVATVAAQLPQGVILSAAVWDPTVTPACPEGCAYVFGGYRGGFFSDPAASSSAVVRFNPAGPTVATVATMPGRGFVSAVWDPRDRPEAGCPLGCAYVFGGRPPHEGTAEVLRFNPTTNRVDTMPIGLPSPVHGTAAVWDEEAGLAYLFGGAVEHPDVVDRIVVYDPVHDLAVVSDARLPVAGYAMAAAADPATRCVLVVGGLHGLGAMTPAAATYRPADLAVGPTAPCWGAPQPPVVQIVDARQVLHDRLVASWTVTDPQGAAVEQRYAIAPDADGVADGSCGTALVPIQEGTLDIATGLGPGFVELCLTASNGWRAGSASVVVALIDDQPPQILALEVTQTDRSSVRVDWATADPYGPVSSVAVSYGTGDAPCGTPVAEVDPLGSDPGSLAFDTGLHPGQVVRICLDVSDGTSQASASRTLRLTGQPAAP